MSDTMAPEPNWEEVVRRQMYGNYAEVCRLTAGGLLEAASEAEPENAARILDFHNSLVRETFGVDPHWMEYAKA